MGSIARDWVVHPAYICPKGSLRRSDVLVVVYHGGKWYLTGGSTGDRNPDIGTFSKENRDPRNLELAKVYETQMARIMKGCDYNDQSTPLAAFLTLKSAIARKDRERIVGIYYSANDSNHVRFRKDLMGENWNFFLNEMHFHSMPAVPGKLAEGQLIPITTCLKGSPYPRGRVTTVYHDGRWYMYYE